MEEAAANRGAKDLNTDSKVDAMSKSLTYWNRRFVEFEDQLVALRNPALGDKTEEPPTKCQPGCTKKGIHKFCSEPPYGVRGQDAGGRTSPAHPRRQPGRARGEVWLENRKARLRKTLRLCQQTHSLGTTHSGFD